MLRFKDFIVEEKGTVRVDGIEYGDHTKPDILPGRYYNRPGIGPVASRYKVAHHYTKTEEKGGKTTTEKATILATHSATNDHGAYQGYSKSITKSREHNELLKKGFKTDGSHVVTPYPDSPPKATMHSDKFVDHVK